MRQLSLAVLSYAAENDQQLPYCNWDYFGPAGSTCYGHGWMFSEQRFRTTYPAGSDLNGVWDVQHPPLDGVMTGVLWPFLNNLSVFHCPIDNPDFYQGTNWLSSYLMTGAQCGWGRLGGMETSSNEGVPGLKLTRFTKPAASVLFWEAQEQASSWWNDGSSAPTEMVLASRHFTGANVACFDGHVEWWDQSTWSGWVNDPNFGRLWCDPLDPIYGR